jgi:hypothetical protein
LAGDHQLTLFEGSRAAGRLQAAGHVLAIATGKSRLGLERALDHSGLRPFFQASRCADECHSKPHPQMLEELMAEFGMAARHPDDRRYLARSADGPATQGSPALRSPMARTPTTICSNTGPWPACIAFRNSIIG